MRSGTIALISGLMLWPILSLTAQGQSALTEQGAQSIARDAYIYFYPLILMDITRKQSTNIEPGKAKACLQKENPGCERHLTGAREEVRDLNSL